MKTNKNPQPFEKRLLAYSITAGVVLASATDVSAQVWGYDTPTLLNSNGQSVTITFNGASRYIVGFNSYHKTSIYTTDTAYPARTFKTYKDSRSGWINDNTASAKWHIYNSAGKNIVALGSGSAVNGSKTFQNVAFSQNFFRTSRLAPTLGTAFIGSAKYIGVQFQVSGSTHYGWIQVTVNTGGTDVTVDSYAYEQTPATDILTGSAFPVELTSFNAAMNGTSALLLWNTATEIDNYGFDIERNTYPDFKNGSTQINQWEKIGFIPGSGNSNSPKSYSFVDPTPPAGLVMYRLKQIDNDGTTAYSKISSLVNETVQDFKLTQNYPNPFNPSTTIEYKIPEAGFVTLKVYDLLGTEVSALVNEKKSAGSYTVTFDASNLPSGTYMYRLEAGSFTETKKLVLLK